MNVQTIRDLFKDKLANGQFAEDGNLEIVNASFIADEPTLFGQPNNDWHERELRWYNSMSLSVKDIEPPVPSIWLEIASTQGMINSNYGWCIFSRENGYQFHRAIDALVKNKASRQAVLIYTRPSMHEDAERDGMRDFICTNTTQLLIRGNQLHHIVSMRSNDAVYGYKGDWFWQNKVLDYALARLKLNYPDLTKGRIYWNAGSLHIYPRHFELVK